MKTSSSSPIVPRHGSVSELLSSADFSMPIVEINYLTHVSCKHRYAYFEVPKAACTSVKAYLRQIEAGDLEINWRLSDNFHSREDSPLLLLDQIEPNLVERILFGEEYFKFAFVRNPFYRSLSAYLSKMFESSSVKTEFYNRHNFKTCDHINFLTFLECIADENPNTLDMHWKPQCLLLHDNRIKFDFIGKLEDFERDMKRVFRQIAPRTTKISWRNLRRNRYHLNVKNAEKYIVDFYDEKAIDKVRRIYEKDFARFGYDIEFPRLYGGSDYSEVGRAG